MWVFASAWNCSMVAAREASAAACIARVRSARNLVGFGRALSVFRESATVVAAVGCTEASS